jgi:hypothetical protein
MEINYKYLKENDLIIFEAIVGSQAYGLNIATSDVDIKYVYMLPLDVILSGTYIDQLNDDNNNKVGYELGRFLELIKSNNPTLLELLNISEEFILYKNPIWNLIEEKQSDFITSQCRWSFGEYAAAQIQKARGLNKKVFNPIEPIRKTPLDFCYVHEGQGSVALQSWLDRNNINQEDCGLVNKPKMNDLYSLFHGDGEYKGIVKSVESNEISYSSVHKDALPIAVMYFNRLGYSSYCKTYKEYWEWVKRRNPARYDATIANGKGYDAKNIMHCHRLLDCCIEIFEGKGIIVKRPNREELLEIRSGTKEFDYLVELAEEKISKIDKMYRESTLPKQVDDNMIKELLLKIRKTIYNL